jgi:hypothetical protein
LSVKLIIEEDSSKQKKFVHITEAYAQILIKILELESDEATLPAIEENLKAVKISANKVSEFIKLATDDARDFLDTIEWTSKDSVKGGRHTTLLQIKPDKIVTNSLSAQILIELSKVTKEKGREVNKENFIKELQENFKYLKSGNNPFETEIIERVNFLIKIGDICYDDSVPNVIWIDWIRYHSQKAYLKLLAEKLPNPSS